MWMVGTAAGTCSGRLLGVSRLATCGGGAAGVGAGTAGAGAGTGTGTGVGTGAGLFILVSPCKSDGVVRVSGAEDDATPRSASSSSMGISRGVKGEADRVTSGIGEGDPSMSLVSGTSRSRLSIWIRLRKFSSEPANRFTLLSMLSTLLLVRVVSSATFLKAENCSSSMAIRCP
jgi:hypothetical protein